MFLIPVQEESNSPAVNHRIFSDDQGRFGRKFWGNYDGSLEDTDRDNRRSMASVRKALF